MGRVTHPDDVDHFVRSFFSFPFGHPKKSGVVQNGLASCEVAGHAVVFGEEANLGQSGSVPYRLPKQSRGSRTSAHNGQKDLDQGALSGPVGANESKDLSAFNLQVNTSEGVDSTAIALFEALGRNCGQRGSSFKKK